MPIPGGIPQPDVFSITPSLNAYMAGTQARYQREDRDAAAEERMTQAIASAAYSADTPEKWQQFLGAMQRRFPDADFSEFQDFSSREMAIGQGLSVTDQFNMDMARRADARAEAAAARAAGGGGPTQSQRELSEWAGILPEIIGDYTPEHTQERTQSIEPPPGEGEIFPGEFEVPMEPQVIPAEASGILGAMIEAGIPYDRAMAIAGLSLTEGGGPARELMLNALAATPPTPAAPRRTTINDQLVDQDTGEVIGDYRTPQPAEAIRPMTAGERAQWRIAENDPRVWAMNPTTGQPSVVGGTPSAGTRLEVTPDGGIVWTQGGPATADAATTGAAAAQDEMLRTAVFGRIDEALDIIDRNPARTTGVGGAIARLLPGTEAVTLRSAVDTIKAQLGFNQLSAMRAAAPSGASGLGQVTERELAFLQSTIATLDLNMNAADLASNLREVQASLTRYYAALDAARLQNLPTNADVAARAGAIREPGGAAPAPNLAAPAAPAQPAPAAAPSPAAQVAPVPIRNPIDAGLLPITDLTMEGYADTFQRALSRGMTPEQAMQAIASQFGLTVEQMFAHLRGAQ